MPSFGDVLGTRSVEPTAFEAPARVAVFEEDSASSAFSDRLLWRVEKGLLEAQVFMQRRAGGCELRLVWNGDVAARISYTTAPELVMGAEDIHSALLDLGWSRPPLA